MTIRYFAAIRIGSSVLLMSLLVGGCGGPSEPVAETTPRADQPGGKYAHPWFEEIATDVGLDFLHVNGHGDEYLFPEIVTGGVGWFDLENDGDLDVYFVQSGWLKSRSEPNPPNRLYRNNGDGTFSDITDASGAGDRGYGMGVASGDYDGDGDVDLYVTNVGPNVMLRNNGDGTMTDVTTETGTGDDRWGASAAFLDYDLDGDLDLFIANYVYWRIESEHDCVNAFGKYDYCEPNAYQAPAYDVLYRNNGDGTFTDVSEEAGILVEPGNGLGVICADFNDDGFPDIYVANDATRNVLWVNQGDGRFVNKALLAGCAVDQDGLAKAGMGVATADVDDDGDFDLLVVNLDNETDSFYRNEGQYFIEEAAAVGLSNVSRNFTRFGVGFQDFDNDGHLDIYEANGKVNMQDGAYCPDCDVYAEPNILIMGLDDGRFSEVMPRGGVAEELIDVSRAAAFADFDNDGGMDILVANLYGRPYLLRNVVADRGHWIGFSLLETHGGSAIGARLTFVVDGGSRAILRDVRTGYSYLAANDPRIHVGLGEAEGGATNLTVRWGDGGVERFEGEFALDRYHSIRRGTGTVDN